VFITPYEPAVIEVYWRQAGTEFKIPKPYTNPNNLALTYTIVEPAGFTYDNMRIEGSYVYLIMNDAFEIDGEIDFVVKASVNATFYTLVY